MKKRSEIESGLERLSEKVLELKRGEVRRLIDARIKEFRDCGKKSDDELFVELCFCITTANCSAERCIMIQREIGSGFLALPERRLATRLKALGYRFHNRSVYLVEARKHKDSLKDRVERSRDEKELRTYLVRNVKGLGYKEASHFLRNVGYTDLAIIDFHIIDLLEKWGLIDAPKAMTKRKYLEIEEVLRELGRKTGLNLAELDLYLWYMETGKVLK